MVKRRLDWDGIDLNEYHVLLSFALMFFREGRLLSKSNMHWAQVYTVVSHVYINLISVDLVLTRLLHTSSALTMVLAKLAFHSEANTCSTFTMVLAEMHTLFQANRQFSLQHVWKMDLLLGKHTTWVWHKFSKAFSYKILLHKTHFRVVCPLTVSFFFFF